jgi:hypothetical protein
MFSRSSVRGAEPGQLAEPLGPSEGKPVDMSYLRDGVDHMLSKCDSGHAGVPRHRNRAGVDEFRDPLLPDGRSAIIRVRPVRLFRWRIAEIPAAS